MFSILEPFADKLEVHISTKIKPIDLHDWSVEHNCPIYQMVQVHGNTVVCINEESPNLQEADGACTNRTDIALSVRYADCQNFVLYDPHTHTLATVHAGYKGIVRKVLSNCITTLQQHYSVDPKNVLVVSDASLCAHCAEFTDPMQELPGIDPQFFNNRLVDLIGAANAELLSCGILPEHIELSSQCTKCDPETWFSYRGDENVKTDSALRNVMIARLLPVT